MSAYEVRLHGGTARWNAFAAQGARLDPNANLSAAGARAPGAAVTGCRSPPPAPERGTHLEVVALLLFGALAALVTLLLVGEVVARAGAFRRGRHLRSLTVPRDEARAQIVAMVPAAGGGHRSSRGHPGRGGSRRRLTADAGGTCPPG